MPTPHTVHHPEVLAAIERARAAAAGPAAGRPFPSPEDWRDVCMYFLLLDRFAGGAAPVHRWDEAWDGRQGGTFAAIAGRLPYLRDLGVNAIWISPVVRNVASSRTATYHGYGAQDLLAVDERWASDGTRDTAEAELAALVRSAHALGVWVILDVVLNHTAEAFWYERGGNLLESFQDAGLLHQSLGGGTQPEVRWCNGYGNPDPAWADPLPPGAAAGPDDAIYPSELRNALLFRRRGAKISDTLSDFPELGFVPGDFDVLRQLAVEYDAAPGDPGRAEGRFPVLSLLLSAIQYLVARYDLDGLRIDTVKYIHPKFIQRFGTAMNEFAYTLGKKNFFTFGEVWDDNDNIARFVGRNGSSEPDGGFGIDAALDFPLADAIRSTCTGLLEQRQGVYALRDVFDTRRNAQEELICSHGDASNYYVTFVDNHDRSRRIRDPASPDAEVRLCLGLLYTLPGIPCLYYGTEQDLAGTSPRPEAFEAVREALWGKFLPDAPGAADLAAAWPQGGTFRMLQALLRLRRETPSLKYGRYYFRQVSGDGTTFGWPMEQGGVVAFSRILADQEVLVVACPNPFQPWSGWVEVDADLAPGTASWAVAFSSLGNGFPATSQALPSGRCALRLALASNELVVMIRA